MYLGVMQYRYRKELRIFSSLSFTFSALNHGIRGLTPASDFLLRLTMDAQATIDAQVSSTATTLSSSPKFVPVTFSHRLGSKLDDTNFLIWRK